MPELPEVTRISECLNDTLKNKYFRKLILTNKSRYTKDGNLTISNYKLINKKYEEDDGNFTFSNTQKITKVFNKGKKIFFKLENGIFIASFLSLYGTWRFDKEEGCKSMIVYSDSETSELKYLYYHDARNYGQMNIVNDYKEMLNTTGPDYFSSKVTFEFWLENLRKVQNNKRYKKPKTIAQFLLMQELISGIGVYTGSDSLYLSKVSPNRELVNISDKEAKRIFKDINKIMDISYDAGGFSYQDYISPYGKKGKYESIITYKDNDSEGNPKIKIKVDGTNWHWCPNVQK